MKATVQSLSSAQLVDRSWIAVLCELAKARLTLLVLLTTLVGFYLGGRGSLALALLGHTLLGTALLASGAAALNQLLEKDYDARMRRTQDRPLPSGRLQPGTALLIGSLSSVAGLLDLAFGVNPTTALLGAITLFSYLLIYTPLKRITTLNTVVGAIPGAMPPLMGWTAAGGSLDPQGWSLFVILAFWQLPHVLAIAWMYREDYARAGFVMLPVFDSEGRRTGGQAVGCTLGLLAASLTPFLFHLAGVAYLSGALALGAFFLWRAVSFQRDVTNQRARQLFYASILYLPLLLGLLVVTRTD